MSSSTRTPPLLTKPQARRLWLHAQRLDAAAPFGAGPEATRRAVEHLGYVQIDTINVIERCHHHILYARIPDYRRADLHRAQSVDKTVFEYWTHALSYVPTRDYRFFVAAMRAERRAGRSWLGAVAPAELRKVLARIRAQGPISIRDIDDDELVEKTHPWASRKPSKRALQRAFYIGSLTISARSGMVKTYELTERHFGWTKPPKAASPREVANYVLDRALRAQGVVSLDSICHLDAPRKPAIRRLIDARVRAGALLPVAIAGAEKIEHWATPDALDALAGAGGGAATDGGAAEGGGDPMASAAADGAGLVHILSPFDPLVIQRKRLHLFFDYAHRFEAYVPKAKRVFGYFALPVLVDHDIAAVLDLKTDRAAKRLLIQRWTWTAPGRPAAHKRRIEDALHRFERFQIAE